MAIDRRRIIWSVVLITPTWRNRNARAVEKTDVALEVRVANDVLPQYLPGHDLTLSSHTVIRFLNTETGVLIQDLERGEGRAARLGDRVQLDYVLRRSNGYFVYSSVTLLLSHHLFRNGFCAGQ